MRVAKNRALLLAIPAIAIYLLFLILPLFQSLVLSFYKWKGFGPALYVGFNNFNKLLHDPVIHIAIKNTFQFVFFSLIIMVPLGLLIANSLYKVVRFQGFYSAVIYMPCIISTIALALMWKPMLNPDFGLINNLFRSMGLGSLAADWLGNPKLALFSVIFVNAWQWTGLCMIIFYTHMQSISKELYEASELDGASGWTELLRITVPLLRESFKINVILVTIGGLKAFDIVYALTNGGPLNSSELLATYMYTVTFRKLDFGYGTSIALVIFILSLLLALVQQKMFKTEDAH